VDYFFAFRTPLVAVAMSCYRSIHQEALLLLLLLGLVLRSSL